MAGLLKDIDPQGLLEYSVVYTDRALNHMSHRFQDVMREINQELCAVYAAEETIIVPGSGTFAMEAVARQFATQKSCLVLRNGWFSYRWSQILEQGCIPSHIEVLKASPVTQEAQSPFAPVAIADAQDKIKQLRPQVVFAPHVETSSGMILPDSYIKSIAAACHDVGALFVLDCIASGAIWINMKDLGVDVVISAPQKGWSSTPCCGLVMLGAKAQEALKGSTSTSFACNLAQWQGIMQAYCNGGHAYYATLPTDGLKQFRDTLVEAKEFGYETMKAKQVQLGLQVRDILNENHFKSTAARGFDAPSVIVCYTDDPHMKSGNRFAEYGMQIAAGVPLACDEPDWFQTFRLGLFGLDKLKHLDRTRDTIAKVLQKIRQAS